MKTLLKITLLLISVHLSARQKEFTVFSFSGKVEIIKADTHALLQVERDSLFSGDKIMLFPGSMIILYCENGGGLQLKNPATYSIDSLATALNKSKGSNFFSDYISFLSREFKRENESIEEYSRKHMREKGGVVRGNCPLLFPPTTLSIVDTEQITFTWSTKTKEGVSLEIYQGAQNGIPVHSYKGDGEQIQLKMYTLSLQKGGTYYWSVNCPEMANCSRYSFKIIADDELTIIKSEIYSIEKEESLTKDLKLILIAACYEKHSLYLLSDQQYLKALHTSPKQEAYKELYSEFLARNGMLNMSSGIINNSK